MNRLSKHQIEAQAARQALDDSEAALYRSRNQLRQKGDQLARAVRLGGVGSEVAQSLQREIQALESQIKNETEAINTAKSQLADILGAFPLLERPWELIESLKDHLPLLLFPVRIETRFVTVENQKELWVRMFPDDIAVHTHESELTQDEVNAGITYWKEVWRAHHETKVGRRADVDREKGAWRVLVNAFGSARAAWIADHTKPVPLDAANIDDLQFPEFAEESLKPESWSRAPRSRIMPDRFVVMAFSTEREVYRKLGNLIPDPLILGPDPQNLEAGYQQQDGELSAGEDIAWIYDFDKAVACGMGVRIPLEPPYTTAGFHRLLVLGLRLSSDESKCQDLVEELFENHNYSPGGLSLIPQGTPTNNTDGKGSGFSSEDPGAETSFAVKAGEVLFEPTDDPVQKSDGQLLAEALGISHEKLQHVQHTDQYDVRDARLMNRALWNGTFGYYLEEMLGLNLDTVGSIRKFFTDYVTGRGPLPAIRVGRQPYGILLTSDFSKWRWSHETDTGQFAFLSQLYGVLRKLETIWRSLLPGVARINAPGDSFQNLLMTLGLHATSAEFHRRHAVGKDYIWNYAAFAQDTSFDQRVARFIAQWVKSVSAIFHWRLAGGRNDNIWNTAASMPGAFSGQTMVSYISEWARSLVEELGYEIEEPPKLFDLAFFTNQDEITDPLVDDIPPEETEKASETKLLKSIYKLPNSEQAGNYISWLAHSSFEDIRAQNFLRQDDLSSAGVPRPLLYRMLRASLLQATFDATMRLYTTQNLLPVEARRELELINLQANRTVTRWEFMEADVNQVLPQASQVSIGHYLLTDEGQALPKAQDLQEVRESLAELQGLTTAQLERLFAEHIDLCSYRLDAWQMGCFHRRLLQERYPQTSNAETEKAVQGIYLGAFGWVENLSPGPEAVHADLSDIPTSLHDPGRDGSLLEQPGNRGFIHGPSLNHAVAAAVLRNAYLTHHDQAHPEKMAVDLTSRRVRTALSFLEGVRNGQELGALLGYQFERGLQDRHGDPSLSQYIPLFRKKYPLVVNKVTQDEGGEQIETIEARTVLDGYALVQAAFFRESPLEYLYGVDVPGTPAKNPDSPHALAIQAEAAQLADTLDAIGDLALAEGIFQVTQGNHDRAGAMMKALTQGGSIPDPEIIKTPRSGTVITQRIALHLEPHADRAWPGALTERAKAEPALNQLLVDLLPTAEKIQYQVRFGDELQPPQSLADLDLQPIDLLYMLGDDLVGEKTELESRIIYQNRRDRQDDTLAVSIDFMTGLTDPEGITLFELLPLHRALRQLTTKSRPLNAEDYQLSSEITALSANDPNSQGYDLPELDRRLDEILGNFSEAVKMLGTAIPAPGADGNPDPGLVNADTLRSALRILAGFGVPDSFPLSAYGESAEARTILTNQAIYIHKIALQKLTNANALITAGQDTTLGAKDRVDRYRSAAQEIFGPMFSVIPHFVLNSQTELQAAAQFRDSDGLTRHHRANPLIVDEWLQGVARVRPGASTLEIIQILGEAFGGQNMPMKALQLPFRETDYWVAVEYPEEFIPQGEFLSLAQVLPSGGFDLGKPHSALLIDEWVEVIPSRTETTGITFHYDQPSTEPPQVLLLAVTPEVTGSWTWDKLVGILNNTLDRAMLRAVEPDQVGRTALGHLLPAVLSAVSSHPFATISTDLIHQTAILALEMPPDNG